GLTRSASSGDGSGALCSDSLSIGAGWLEVYPEYCSPASGSSGWNSEVKVSRNTSASDSAVERRLPRLTSSSMRRCKAFSICRCRHDRIRDGSYFLPTARLLSSAFLASSATCAADSFTGAHSGLELRRHPPQ